MNCPSLTSTADLEPFAEYLLDSPELWDLIDAFSNGPHGMAQRRTDVADVILAGSLADPGEAAQAGRVLARWTSQLPAAGPPSSSSIKERITWLSGFAAHRWDFRVGRERDFIPTSCELLAADLAEKVYQVARRWDMLTPAPAQGHFDHIIVLGGLLRANFNRPRAAAELLSSGSATSPSVVGLGAPRPMSEAEIRLAEAIGCDATTEQAALERGLEAAFEFTGSAWEPTNRPNLRQAQVGDGLTIRSAGAPLNPDGTRANTGGAFGWFMDDSGLVRPGQSILSITTPIYWIAGHISLMTRIPPGATLVTVGADPARALPGLEQTFRSQHYLQEIKTAIDVLAKALPTTEVAASKPR